MKKLAVYTVLVGNYDQLRQPEAILDGVDYICFSNDIQAREIGVWQVRTFDYRNPSGVRESRFPKLNPHAVLPDCEYSLYVDAKIRIDRALNDRILELMSKDCHLAMIPHMIRNCVYQEALSLACGKIGEQDLIYKQTRFLLREKFPQNRGLYDCAVMFRKNAAPEVIHFSTAWWKLYNNYSSRDQMSVTYALKQANLTPEILFPSTFYADHTFDHLKKRKNYSDFSLLEKIVHYYEIFRMRWLLTRSGIKF